MRESSLSRDAGEVQENGKTVEITEHSSFITRELKYGATEGGRNPKLSVMEEPQSVDYGEEGYSDYSTDDEIQYCDCIASTLAHSLPGTPGKRGIVPYISVYDDQERARKRGYWLPGVPVNAKITKAEKNQDRGIHFINKILYTIELAHGPFKWSVVRTFKDFTMLNNRLKAHRAAERFRAPVRRAQERVDEMLESVGIDVISDHKEECPYYKRESRRSRKQKQVEILKRTADAFDEAEKSGNGNGNPAPIASIESTSPTDEEQVKVKIQTAVQSGILEDETDDTRNDSVKKRKVRTRKRHRLPHFPMIPDSMVSNLEQRREQLENWLQMLLHIPINRNHHETAEFLEVSRFSFINDLGGKHNEGFVKKRPGGARVFYGWKQCCVRYCLPWSKRWLMVRDTFVAYMDHRTEQIRLVLLMDKDFKIAAGGKEAEGIPTGLIIYNTQHELHLKCRRVQNTVTWKKSIENVMQGPGKMFIDPHRFGSSFPIRENGYGKWFVDAKDFMEQAADMMELAREEIFIADWWLSPEIYMKRPALEGTKWRLDEILKRKAQQGVRIFVLLYKEMEMALGLNSIYTKRKLQELHPNIKVMRHPDHYPGTGTFFWAHHEKLIVIDQLISFVGGVDLCFGRWDDNRHLLTDLGSVQFASQHQVTGGGDYSMSAGLRALARAPLTLSPLGLEEHEEVVPRGDVVPQKTKQGEDQRDGPLPGASVVSDPAKGEKELETVYTDKETGGVVVRVWKRARKSNSEKRVSRESGMASKTPALMTVVEETNKENRSRQSRQSGSLPKHTTSIPKSLLVEAAPASSLFEKAVESGMDMQTAVEKYKEYVYSGKVEQEKHRAQTPPGKESVKKNRLSRVVGNWKSKRAKRRWKQVLEQDDATGAYELDWLRLKGEQNEGEDQLDGGVKMWIGKDYVNFIVKDFIEVDLPFHDFIDRGITPRMPWHDIHSVTFGEPARDVARHFIQRWNATKTEKLKDDASYPYLLPKTYDNLKVPRVFKKLSESVNVQVLRSVSNWSCLVNGTEDSIQAAYLSLIANSKHYIYIENQFFVSMVGNGDVQNEICKVLISRIERAHKDKQNFRVYILIPLMPGFEGDVGAPGGSSLQAVLHWTYQSLSRGPNSLFSKLKEKVVDPHEYVSVCSLRTYDLLCGKLVSELIYIHCKLMIVDDEHVIIGSANINDRSQAGNRDSEVCVLYTDTVKERSTMDGKPYDSGRFAKSLRLQLMREHLSLLADSRRPAKFKYDVTCEDPVAASFFVDVWQKTAKSNTLIYEEVFRAYPTDNVQSFEEMEKWVAQMSLAEYSPQQGEERLRELKGVLVEFPLNFLLNARLTPGITSKEGMVPSAVFT